MDEVCEQANVERNKERVQFFQYAVLWILIPLLWIAIYISGLALGEKGELADSDCYMRLLRVEDLHNGGRWYDPVDLRSNAPYGQTAHWTRPLDVLLLLGAAPIALVTDFKSALFWWGVIISPLVLFVTTMVLPWSTRPLLGRKGSFSVSFIFLCQIALLICFQPGRPDHQSLLIFLVIISIGFVLRIIFRPFSIRLCYMAGAVSALSMWINVESMVPVGVTIGMLGLLWMWENGDFLKKSLHYILALFVVTGLNLVLERAWHNLLAEEYDRLSVVHFSVFGFISILWITLFMLNRHTQLFRRRTNRFLSIPVGLVILVLTIFIFFPKFFKGPFADIDPRIARLWLGNVAEMQPLLSSSRFLLVSVQLLGSVIISFGFFIYLLFRNTRSEKLKGWIYIFLMVAVFTCLTLVMYRWAYYAQAVVAIPMAELMCRTLARCRDYKNKLLMVTRNVLVKMTFILGLMFLGAAVDITFGSDTGTHQKISLIPVCNYLNETDKWQKREFRILTHIDFGEEILYRTPHEVIGTPTATGTSHRNGQGILDTFDIMTAENNEDALEIIRKRGIDLILICPAHPESQRYKSPEQISNFYTRLLQNEIPHWLRKVELPSNISSSFILFEIVKQ